jgi:hypothetical protein
MGIEIAADGPEPRVGKKVSSPSRENSPEPLELVLHRVLHLGETEFDAGFGEQRLVELQPAYRRR